MIRNEILEKKLLSDGSVYFKLHAPEIAKNAFAGNFLIVITHEGSERIPLTIMEYQDDWVSIVVKPVGFSTQEMVKLETGDVFHGVLGPLGQNMHVVKNQTVLMVAGGVGIAPVIPQLEELKKHNNHVIVIHGGREKDAILFEERVNKTADEYIICTDDGSYGEMGLVTDIMEKELEEHDIDLVITIGPLIMMKYVSLLSKKYNIKTMAGLNSIMLDGTGMCGSCRVEYDGEVKFACVDGPDMDAHKIDFDVLIKRNSRFKEQEDSVRL